MEELEEKMSLLSLVTWSPGGDKQEAGHFTLTFWVAPTLAKED